jgi:hypothetical protein
MPRNKSGGAELSGQVMMRAMTGATTALFNSPKAPEGRGCACLKREETRAMEHPSEEQIRTRAHQLWELQGSPEGREEEFWLEAERELKEKAGAVDVIKESHAPNSF